MCGSATFLLGWVFHWVALGLVTGIAENTDIIKSLLTDAETNTVASVDGDPDFIVGVQGLEQPLCFRMEGQPGHVVRLLQDPGTGVVVNARLTRPVPGSSKTYLGAVLIARRNFRVVAKVGRVHVNRYRFPWGPVTLRLVHGHRVLIAPTLMALTLRNMNVTLIVKRHLPEGGLTSPVDDDDEDNRASISEDDLDDNDEGEYANNANTLSWANRGGDVDHGPNPGDAALSEAEAPRGHQSDDGEHRNLQSKRRRGGQQNGDRKQPRRPHRQRHRRRGKNRSRRRGTAPESVRGKNGRNITKTRTVHSQSRDNEKREQRQKNDTHAARSGQGITKTPISQNHKTLSLKNNTVLDTAGSAKNQPGHDSRNTGRKPARPRTQSSLVEDHTTSEWANPGAMSSLRERRNANERPDTEPHLSGPRPGRGKRPTTAARGEAAEGTSATGTEVTASVRPRHAAAYVGFYIADARDLSTDAHGLLGQFLHKSVKLQRVRRKSNGVMKARLFVERPRPQHVKATLRTRTNLALNTSSACWWLQHAGSGVVELTYADYLVPRFRVTDMLPLSHLVSQ